MWRVVLCLRDVAILRPDNGLSENGTIADKNRSQGVYALSAWSLLNLDCGSWSCENRMWPKYDVFSNTSTVCMPGNVSFPSADVHAVKLA
jgi:hypothetical protein